MARKVAADHGEKAAQILDAAARTFAREGYERATMAGIARAAGFSKASAYHYYESKEAVLYALLARSLDDLLESVVAADPGRDVPPRQRLARLLEAYLTAFVSHIAVVTPLLLDLSRLRAGWREEIRRRERRLVELFGEAAEAVGGPLPPHMAAFLLLGAANWTYYWYHPTGGLPVDAFARAAAQLLAGLQD